MAIGGSSVPDPHMNDNPKRPILMLLTSHWVSMLGVALVSTAGFSWLFVLPIQVRGHTDNPYIGIVVFIVIPVGPRLRPGADRPWNLSWPKTSRTRRAGSDGGSGPACLPSEARDLLCRNYYDQYRRWNPRNLPRCTAIWRRRSSAARLAT
jgi:hypothetical protein